MTFNDYQF